MGINEREWRFERGERAARQGRQSPCKLGVSKALRPLDGTAYGGFSGVGLVRLHGCALPILFGVSRASDLVDDALDDDDLHVDVAREIGNEFGDVVVNGSGGEADGIA